MIKSKSSKHISNVQHQSLFLVHICWEIYSHLITNRGFPGSSDGKESACNAGGPSSIPGLERFTGEGIGYQLQDSWTSLVAQLVENLSAMQETLV